MKKKATKKLSRQRIYQLRKIKAGCCSRCGKPRENFKSLCNKCRILATSEQRERLGFKKWTKGRVGRPPVVA